jgi:ABC-type transport system involved in cytochrome c biogenesis permease subunit
VTRDAKAIVYALLAIAFAILVAASKVAGDNVDGAPAAVMMAVTASFAWICMWRRS